MQNAEWKWSPCAPPTARPVSFWLKPFLFKAILLARVDLFVLLFVHHVCCGWGGIGSGFSRQFTGRSVEDYFCEGLVNPRFVGRSRATSDPPSQEQKRNKSSSVKTEAKKKDPPQVAPPRRESITPDAAQAAARQRVGKLEAILTTLEDDDETAAVIQVALTKARVRAQAQERPFLERVESTRKFVERPAEEGRTGPCECRQGQRPKEALAESSGLPGEGIIFVGRWGREVVAGACCTAKRVPSPFTVPTNASRPRHHRRDATNVACHGRIATRVNTIERFLLLVIRWMR